VPGVRVGHTDVAPEVAGDRPLDLDPTRTTERDLLDVLEASAADLGAGRWRQAVERLDSLDAAGGAVSDAIRSTATALQLEADGRSQAAASLMEMAADLDVPLPVLLEAQARFFVRVGMYDRAYASVLAHEVQAPGAIADLGYSISPSEQARFAPWAVRASLAVADPDLYGLLAYKVALEEQHGSRGAGMILAGTSAAGTHRRAASLPLRPLIDYAREHGEAYHEAIPSAVVSAAWPPVLGEPRRPPYRARSRTLFTAALEDVVVSGKSNVLLLPDVALHDIQAGELERIPVDLRVDPLISGLDGDSAILSVPVDRAEPRQITEALWLGGVHSGAFGHWICEFLPKVWALAATRSLDLDVIVDRQMPRQHLEALRFFAPSARPVVIEPGEQLRVGRLWVASQLVYMPVGPLPGTVARPGDAVIDAPGLLAIMEPFRASVDALERNDAARDLHLARPGAGRRQLDGASQLQAELERRGYASVHLEELTFEEQLRAMRNAERVVGPDGSALLMTLFGRPGLRVGVFSHPYLEEFEWFTQLSVALGQELLVATGPVTRLDPTYRTFSDYRIDPSAAARLLDALEGAASPDEPGA
jgi:hypothetical protein